MLKRLYYFTYGVLAAIVARLYHPEYLWFNGHKVEIIHTGSNPWIVYIDGVKFYYEKPTGKFYTRDGKWSCKSDAWLFNDYTFIEELWSPEDSSFIWFNDLLDDIMLGVPSEHVA